MNPTKNKNGAKTINQIKNIIRLTFKDDFMLYLFLFKLNYQLKIGIDIHWHIHLSA
jgi:hypothetical protein